MVTDIEHFQPKRKRPKVCHRTYRLLGLKSTTPEELYARKVSDFYLNYLHITLTELPI
jgi:hypothetical protein